VDHQDGANSFAQIVDRHAGWILAAARRRLRDDHLADDARQAVFLILSQKASQLAGMKSLSLSAWLFHTMHFACCRINRSRGRRRNHERSAGLARDRRDKARGEDDSFLLLLEDSIAQLSPREREAVVRRFYQAQDFASVGAAMGISADAARKRVTRVLATIREMMLHHGVDVLPEPLLRADGFEPLVAATPASPTALRPKRRRRRRGYSSAQTSLAKGTITMAEQAQIAEFPVISAEYFVTDVEANLEFFERLGFRRRWSETPDAMGRLPRASLASGAGRIWLRRADQAEGTRPAPGVTIYFWINGGPDELIRHRNTIAAEGIAVSPFFDDHSLRNFTVTSPDGYVIGFFTSYR
jgi:RNA polymerase sigma factor (sigma-70 family)